MFNRKNYLRIIKIIPATLSLLAINIIVFLISLWYGMDTFWDLFASHQLGNKDWRWYQSVTAAFTHANLIHLSLNMFVFFQFSALIEMYYDMLKVTKAKLRIFVIYFIIAVSSDYMSQLIDFFIGIGFNRAAGASGVVCGYVSLIALSRPKLKVNIMLIIRNVNLKKAVIGMVLFELIMGIYFQDRSFIGHTTHLSGLIMGALLFAIPIKKHD